MKRTLSTLTALCLLSAPAFAECPDISDAEITSLFASASASSPQLQELYGTHPNGSQGDIFVANAGPGACEGYGSFLIGETRTSVNLEFIVYKDPAKRGWQIAALTGGGQ